MAGFLPILHSDDANGWRCPIAWLTSRLGEEPLESRDLNPNASTSKRAFWTSQGLFHIAFLGYHFLYVVGFWAI
jgi:hypothetical protein